MLLNTHLLQDFKVGFSE